MPQAAILAFVWLNVSTVLILGDIGRRHRLAQRVESNFVRAWQLGLVVKRTVSIGELYHANAPLERV